MFKIADSNKILFSEIRLTSAGLVGRDQLRTMDAFTRSPVEKTFSSDLDVLSTIRSPVHGVTNLGADDSGFSEIYHPLDHDDVRCHLIDADHVTHQAERNRVRFSTPCKSTTVKQVLVSEKPNQLHDADLSPLVPLLTDFPEYSFGYGPLANMRDNNKVQNKENAVSLIQYDETNISSRRVLAKDKTLTKQDGTRQGNGGVYVGITDRKGTVLNGLDDNVPNPSGMIPYSVTDFYGTDIILRNAEEVSTSLTVNKTVEKLFDCRKLHLVRESMEDVFPPKSVLESSYNKQMRNYKLPPIVQLVKHSKSLALSGCQNQYSQDNVSRSNICQHQPTLHHQSILNLIDNTSQPLHTPKTFVEGSVEADKHRALIFQGQPKFVKLDQLETNDEAKDDSGRYETSYSDISEPESDSKIPPQNNNLPETVHEPTFSDISDSEAHEISASFSSSLIFSSDVVNKQHQCPESVEIRAKPQRPEVVRHVIRPSTLKRIRRGRKTRIPTRSPAKTDPRFRGVTVLIQTEFRNGTSRLNISAFYSNIRNGVPSKPSPYPLPFSGSPDDVRCPLEQEPEYTSTAYSRDQFVHVKVCASCRTRRTPLWRDAEDGTPLCNACGIRYKKYRLRCSRCWHIPKKDIKTYPNCPLCGASLRFSFHRKTSW